VIGDRAFHYDPSAVSELAHNLMLGLKKGGMQAIGKHFPGHGYIQSDSHLEKSIDGRSYRDIEMNDLIPFQQMIHYGLAGIMPAHVIYPKIDQSPAGFSTVWLQKILRTELQFEGCIFSDDLSMQGAADYLESIVMRAQAALNAGCDMILVCNNPAGTDEILNELHWEMSATSLSRLARLHGRNNFGSMTKLREQGEYIQALREISGVGCQNEELPL
jgi:beta-N-acetylhexosaminidase